MSECSDRMRGLVQLFRTHIEGSVPEKGKRKDYEAELDAADRMYTELLRAIAELEARVVKPGYVAVPGELMKYVQDALEYHADANKCDECAIFMSKLQAILDAQKEAEDAKIE